MNNKCQILDFDADVLLFNKDTYIVSTFKELICEKFRQKFCSRLRDSYPEYSISEMLKNLSINEVKFKSEDIIWQSSIEGVNCQVFRVGSTGWESGKLRVKVCTEIIPKDNLNITVLLEFYPDEAAELESPLDDIRKMLQAQAT